MRSEACLVAAQKKKQRCEEKLQSLKEQTGLQQCKASEIQTETERIHEECCEMDLREEDDDEETVALNADQVSYYLLFHLLAFRSKYVSTIRPN